jgi:methyl-accepting chemotaxis protein
VKLERATRTWLIFATLAALAVFGSGVMRAIGVWGHGALFGAFAVSMVVLIYLAINLANIKPRLNLTLAAETVVALGIFSLIISIAVVLLNVSEIMSEIESRDLSIEDMRRFAWPFGEGLAAAAIAPFVATLLRHVESNISTVESGEVGMATAAREAETLAAELKATTGNIKIINAELAGTLGSALKATSTLSATLQTEAERLKVALHRVQAEATGLAEASQKGRVAVGELGTGLSELNASTKDARELLDALGKLIESVERYIKPDR